MPTLDDAILLAVQAHKGQTDKTGQPYILHPLRVMLAFDSEEERIIGILHDVVEDTPYTLAGLREMGYAESIVQALDCLTRRELESYEQFIDRVQTNRLAARVKRADLRDNMDLRRLPTLTERDFERLRRYVDAWSKLNDQNRIS